MSKRPAPQGLTLLEVVVATAVLAVVSLAVVNGFSATAISSIDSDRALKVQGSLQACYESLHDIPYAQVLSWNGVVSDRGDHRVVLSAHLVQKGLVQVEFTALDKRNGRILARMATLRSGEY